MFNEISTKMRYVLLEKCLQENEIPCIGINSYYVLLCLVQYNNHLKWKQKGKHAASLLLQDSL